MSRKSSSNEYILNDLGGLRKVEREEGQREEVVGERRLFKALGDSSGNNRRQFAAMATGAGAEYERAARHQFQDSGTPKFVYILSAFAALGGFLFGYDTGVVSGALLLLKKEFALNELWQELVVSATVGAAAISALSGGFFNDRFGRKPCILFSSFLFMVGAVVMTVANDRYTLLAGRVVVGLGIGLASMTVTVYIAEAAPFHMRGRLVTINTLFITGGQFFASIIDGAFSYLETNGWRYYSATILQMSGVQDDKLAIWLAAVTAGTNFIFAMAGVWLVEKAGRRKLTLFSLTGTAVSLVILAVGFLLSALTSPPVTLHPRDPSGRNVSCINYKFCDSCILDPNCGFCFKMQHSNVTASSCVPVSNKSDTNAAWGRCSNESEFKKEGVSWAFNFCPTKYSWTALLGLILYLVFFAPGMGSMPWTVNSEIYPMWARSTGNAMASGVNWIFNVLVSVTFLHLAEYLTYYGVFFLYAGLATLGLFFIYGCLPETKGIKLEEIESLFENRLCTCGLLNSDEASSPLVQRAENEDGIVWYTGCGHCQLSHHYCHP
ncbi:proton myo-inositol cotransporter-like isoform X5 [Hypanus sabinus]|uniref:proton myo-inositol cotransporter-like isoform X5 n=1 Tax=Hypanus sabinus TaxID=79690 RepID=UPI0028C3AF7E|nr:proton myo-inositol cotransporter-like isoform X5 [Hypanus sabinus]